MMDETNVATEVVNWKELALYIALTHKQEEIDKPGLSNVIHCKEQALYKSIIIIIIIITRENMKQDQNQE